MATAPAQATVTIKVAEPVSDPITVHVKVQDNGAVVANLGADAIAVTVDGNEVLRDDIGFSLPEHPDRRASVMFVMDYSGSLFNHYGDELTAAITGFIDRMSDGDFAGIVKFAGKNDTVLVAPLQPIDDDAKVDLIKTANDEFIVGRNSLYDAINKALEQFQGNTSLPPGPRTIIVASHGRDNDSAIIDHPALLTDRAREMGISFYTIGIGPSDIAVPGTNLTGWELLGVLANKTGGEFFEGGGNTAKVYAEVSEALRTEYLLTFEYGVAACQDYKIQVAVEGLDPVSQTVSSQCDRLPPQSGGGAFGPLGLIAGLSLLALRRRLPTACMRNGDRFINLSPFTRSQPKWAPPRLHRVFLLKHPLPRPKQGRGTAIPRPFCLPRTRDGSYPHRFRLPARLCSRVDLWPSGGCHGLGGLSRLGELGRVHTPQPHIHWQQQRGRRGSNETIGEIVQFDLSDMALRSTIFRLLTVR